MILWPMVLILMGILSIVTGGSLLVMQVRDLPDVRAQYRKAVKEYERASEKYQQASQFLNDVRAEYSATGTR